MAEGIAISDDKQELTDGFNLIIDAMKLNGVKTIYGVPGIPITDFGRMVGFGYSSFVVSARTKRRLRSRYCRFSN